MSFLKNLFGGSPKKSSGDAVETMKRRQQAAIEVLGILQEHFKTTFESHPASVLYAGAWLAGTSLFRSFGYTQNVAPGTVILSDKANDEWPKLMNLYLYAVIEKSRIKLNPKDMIIDIPQEYKPKKAILKIQELFQDSYNQIMRKYGFDYLEGAQVGAFICAIATETHCVHKKDLDPKLAAGIVSMGFVEGAKTSPVPLNSRSSPTTSNSDEKEVQASGLIRTIAQSSISGSGERLVLGERDVVVQEALDNGGKFVLVHPEVESKLKQGNYDPYLIYVTALIIEMESKISQIDFVNANVDELAQKWSGKSQQQAPVHIRQMLWLKGNAEKYGYQQSGNSWKLK